MWGRRLLVLPVLSVGLAVAACSSAPETPTPTPANPPDQSITPSAPLSQMDQRFTAAQTAFGFDLFQKVVQGEKRGENLFISPSSVAFALAMTYNGAKVETQAAMEDALRLQGMTMEDVNKAAQAWLQALTAQTPKVEMSIANSIWLWQGVPLLPDFTRRVQDAYGARHQPGLQQAGRCGHH